MDARAWRAVAVSFVLFGGVGVVFLFGASLLGLKGAGAVQVWMGAGVHGPWALPAAVAGFSVLAFLGVPQVVLVAAAVVAFGPWTGFAYSWIGNLISSILGFYAGRRIGARVLRNYAGKGVNDFVDMIGRNGFWASLVVRLVPSAPFVVVNMAAGVTPMPVSQFVFGTALGSIPKIALVAYAGNSAIHALNGGGPSRWIKLALVGALWIGMALVARAWLKRKEAERAALNAQAALEPAAPEQP
ncbi:MAG: TVP38/TMEM64 family protein [Caulobacteraceae bacterium]